MSLLLALLLSQLRVLDEGVVKGMASQVNCTGSGVTCTVNPTGVIWTLDASAGGGGAPTTAGYWTTVADGGLSAEVAMGGLGNGLILNTTTTGVPTIYAGATCTTPNLMQTLTASGAPGCYQLKLDNIANPTGDVAFTFGSAKKILWTFTGSTDVAFSIDGDGAFTGTGDLVHIHKSGTGSAVGADALHLEVTSDTNMTGFRLTMPSTSAAAVNQIGSSFISGTVSATSFVGPLTGNASTATALSTTGGAGTFWANNNTWQTPPGGGGPATEVQPTATAGADCTGSEGNFGIDSTVNNSWLECVTATSLWSTTPGTRAKAAMQLGTLGTNTTVLHGNSGGNPTYAGIAVADFVANQGTTTQVLHGNAAGQPSWGAVAVADLPPVTVAKGGTGQTTITTNQLYTGVGADTLAAKTLPSCSNATTSKLLYDTATQAWSCGTDQTGAGAGVGTQTRLAATWASSATADTLGIIGTGTVPMTSPSYAAGAPYTGKCMILMTRPSTTNQPRYGIQSSGTVTTANTMVTIGLAGTLPARTAALQSTNALATAGCAAGCTANVVTGGAARVFMDIIDIAGVMNATGTISLIMAPSAAAAHTAQIGSHCVWY